MNIAVIPARGGSRRIKNKNIRLFHGKPIIAYSIEAAKATGLFDMVVVSTEDEEISNVARKYGANIIHRHADYAKDEVGTQDVMRYTLSILEDGKLDSMTYLPPFQYACCIYATSPLMSVDDLRRGHEVLAMCGCDYVYGISAETFESAAQFYWGKAKSFIDGVPLDGPGTVYVGVDKSRVCDINTEDDWKRAEQMYAALQEK